MSSKPYIEPLGTLEFVQPMGTRVMVLSHAWGIRVNEVTYRVPRGMQAEVSIPRLFWRVIDPPLYSKLVPGAVIHDGAYKGTIRATSDEDDWMPVEKAEADELLRIISLWNGTPEWKCTAVYATVHLFGFVAWKAQHKKYAGTNLKELDWRIPKMQSCFSAV